MRSEDSPVGRLLSRRDALTLLGAAGAVWFLGSSVAPRQVIAGAPGPSCIVRPEQTEGPYFVDERLHRSDIRSDPADGRVTAGTPLTLTFQIMSRSPSDCRPLPGAYVDIWHCDAAGIYSDVEDPWFNTTGRKFLRGYQVTDARGQVRFVTIYPGWYPGRTVHIHFKIRTAPLTRRSFDFTSQLYFEDDITDRVYTTLPYAERGPRTARNRHDRIFRHGGDQLMLAPSPTADGYAATFSIGLQLP
jgi:protocatechuate 3,4-dioxygenase beta subunit